jgi:hypothetical protein
MYFPCLKVYQKRQIKKHDKVSHGFWSGVRGLFSIYERYTKVINYYFNGYTGLYARVWSLCSTPTPKKLKPPTHTYATKKILAKI